MPTRLLTSFRDFVRLESAGGILLAGAALLALVLANSPLSPMYEELLALRGTVAVGALEVSKPLLLWLNDGWMAVFFFLVGLEIKREIREGELSDLRTSLLPVAGALGGMVLPALIYAALNFDDPARLRGWAIPAATDIAFALGVMSLLGPRVPLALKVMLTAIAIIDDLGAIIIIALFYAGNLSPEALVLAALAIAALIALNLSGVRSLVPYVLVGAVLWVCVLKSGVHATLAGVITALAIPLAERDGHSPARYLEHVLHPWVAFLILPAFAFANAGVSFAGIGLAALGDRVTLGIALGLVAGKALGVWGAMRLAVMSGLARPLEGVTERQAWGLAVLCGIGFTMSLFIGGLAFHEAERAVSVRLGVLSGSVVAGLLGYLLLRTGPRTAAA